MTKDEIKAEALRRYNVERWSFTLDLNGSNQVTDLFITTSEAKSLAMFLATAGVADVELQCNHPEFPGWTLAAFEEQVAQEVN